MREFVSGNSDNQIEMFAKYPDIVSVDDLMKMLRIGRSAAYCLVQNGTISNFKIGKIYKIPKASVIDYISKGAC